MLVALNKFRYAQYAHYEIFDVLYLLRFSIEKRNGIASKQLANCTQSNFAKRRRKARKRTGCAPSYKKLEIIPLNNTIMFISCRKLVYIMLKTLYQAS
nr:MAG TPA: hypothetical protein [Siphoviridae sp. cty4Z2]DAR87780.1 MAG TPA: hypothetical protein [Caudoviricetes sp.]